MSEPWLGIWRLTEFTATLPDGSIRHPMGEDAVGQLIYTESGRMSAQLSRGGRQRLAVERLESFGRASVEAKAAAFDSFMSYAGRFEFDGVNMLHYVEIASVPDIVGQTLVREIQWVPAISLAYDVVTRSGTRRYVLRWAAE